MARVLVTGANGHIGSNTVRSLIRRGHEVIPFVRRTSDLRGIEKLGLAYRYGDVTDYDSLEASTRGCDVVVHHAAAFKLSSKNPDDEIIRPGVVGTQNIFKAAEKAGIQRLIYTSSGAAVGAAENPDTLVDESNWIDDTEYPYFMEKSMGEREAVKLSEKYGIPTVRILPTMVLGPYDYRMTPSMRGFADFVNGKTPTYPGGTNYVDVRDVAEAHASAIDKGEPGGRYLVGAENVTYQDAGRLIAKITGSKPFHVNSTGLTMFISGLIEFGTKLIGSDPLVTRETAREFVGKYLFFDCSLARDDLGLTPRPIEEAFTDSVRWLLYMDEIKPRLAKRLAASLPPDPEW